MSPQECFDRRIAAIHRLGGAGGRKMDIRHEEFMTMADAFLGPDFDKEKLNEVKVLQRKLHDAQAMLYLELQAKRIDRSKFINENNKISSAMARQCELVLGETNFQKLFGASPSELDGFIDKDSFLQNA